jgi:hypothetical protein
MIPGMPQEPPPGTPGGPGYIPPGVPGSPEFIAGMPGSPEYQPLRRRVNGRDVEYVSHGKVFGLGAVVFVILFVAALAFIVFVALNLFGAH